MPSPIPDIGWSSKKQAEADIKLLSERVAGLSRERELLERQVQETLGDAAGLAADAFRQYFNQYVSAFNANADTLFRLAVAVGNILAKDEEDDFGMARQFNV